MDTVRVRARDNASCWELILAPLSTSRATTSEWPSEAAANKGVHPPYQR